MGYCLIDGFFDTRGQRYSKKTGSVTEVAMSHKGSSNLIGYDIYIFLKN